jgi:hypothetical protein
MEFGGPGFGCGGASGGAAAAAAATADPKPPAVAQRRSQQMRGNRKPRPAGLPIMKEPKPEHSPHAPTDATSGLGKLVLQGKEYVDPHCRSHHTHTRTHAHTHTYTHTHTHTLLFCVDSRLRICKRFPRSHSLAFTMRVAPTDFDAHPRSR